MFEKEADEYRKYMKSEFFLSEPQVDLAYQGFIDGVDFGYNKAMEEWKNCFLSCSSPFCSKHFPTVESSGVLGNMEKKEK